jgi:O-antigen/teichoic acid export membrane protein
MASALLEKLWRNRGSLLPVVWGPLLGMLGLAVGMRVLTEVASPETFGEAKLVQAATGLGLGLVSRPFAQFAMREYHDAKQLGREIAFESFARRMQAVLAGSLTALTVAGLVVAMWLGLPITWTAAAAAGGMLLVELSMSIDLSLAQTRNLQRLVSVIDAAKQWGQPLLAAALIYAIADTAALLIWGNTIVAVGCGLALRRSLGTNDPLQVPTPDETATWRREARRFVIPMLGAGLFNWVIGVGDRYLLAYYCGPDEVGRYSAVYGLVSLPIVAAGGMLARALFPFVFRAASRNDAASEGWMLRNMFLLASAIGATAVAGVVLFGPWALRLVLAPRYLEGSQPLLIWLAAGHACLIVAFCLDMKAYARKLTLAFTIATAAAAVTNVALNLLWIPLHGGLGAARATFAGYLVYLLASALVLSRATKAAAAGAAS